MENILTKTIKSIETNWYDAGVILGHYDEETKQARDENEFGMSDTLALFVVRELCDVYDPAASDRDNAAEFERALGKAVQDLQQAVRDVPDPMRESA